jgi:hypothetical protein
MLSPDGGKQNNLTTVADSNAKSVHDLPLS